MFQIECDDRQQQTARLKVIKSLESAPISISVQETNLCSAEQKEDQDVKPEGETNENSLVVLQSDTVKQIDSFKEEVVQEGIANENKKVAEKTDGLMNLTKHVLVTADYDVAPKIIERENIDLTSLSDCQADKTTVEPWEDREADSETETESEDSEDEFMADGERVRKTSRGFKQISNCKRFWKASLLTGQTAK